MPVTFTCSRFGTFVKNTSVTKTQLALSYILSYSEISTVIPGIRTAEQAESNTNGLVQLTKEDMKFIEELGTTDFVELMDLIRQKEI